MVVELAHVGLMALGNAGNLDVANAARGQVVAQLGGHVALRDLAVVQVKLHFQVGCANLLHQRVGSVLAVKKVARKVPRVDGLNQHIAARSAGFSSGPSQVGAVGGLQGGVVCAGRRNAGHHVDARAVQRLRIVQGLYKAVAKLRLTPRQTGDATLACVPVARRSVEKHLLQTMVLQAAV